jgi:hypothetical protein
MSQYAKQYKEAFMSIKLSTTYYFYSLWFEPTGYYQSPQEKFGKAEQDCFVATETSFKMLGFYVQ